jgi:hypothetical protein
MVMSEPEIKDRLHRALAALQGAGHPAIGAAATRMIMGGNAIKGMSIYYLPERIALEGLRGQEGYVFLFVDELAGRDKADLLQRAEIMNSRIPQ